MTLDRALFSVGSVTPSNAIGVTFRAIWGIIYAIVTDRLCNVNVVLVEKFTIYNLRLHYRVNKISQLQ